MKNFRFSISARGLISLGLSLFSINLKSKMGMG